MTKTEGQGQARKAWDDSWKVQVSLQSGRGQVGGYDPDYYTVSGRAAEVLIPGYILPPTERCVGVFCKPSTRWWMVAQATCSLELCGFVSTEQS